MKICIIYSKKYIPSLYCIYNLYAGTLKLLYKVKLKDEFIVLKEHF